MLQTHRLLYLARTLRLRGAQELEDWLPTDQVVTSVGALWANNRQQSCNSRQSSCKIHSGKTNGGVLYAFVHRRISFSDITPVLHRLTSTSLLLCVRTQIHGPLLAFITLQVNVGVAPVAQCPARLIDAPQSGGSWMRHVAPHLAAHCPMRI